MVFPLDSDALVRRESFASDPLAYRVIKAECGPRDSKIIAAEYSKLQAARHSVVALVRTWGDDYGDLVRQIDDCGRSDIWWYCRACHRLERKPAYCGNRICPVCVKRRGDRFKTLRLKQVEGYRYPFHVVLTQPVAPGRDLLATYDRFRSALRRWKKIRDVKRIIHAGVYSIEIAVPGEKDPWGRVHGPGREWYHVHCHAIVSARSVDARGLLSRGDLDTLKAAWAGAGGGVNLWIKRLHTNAAKRTWLSDTVKYLYKPDGFLGSDLRAVYDELKGSRFGGTWGATYGKQVKADPAPIPGCKTCGATMRPIGYGRGPDADLILETVVRGARNGKTPTAFMIRAAVKETKRRAVGRERYVMNAGKVLPWRKSTFLNALTDLRRSN